MVSELVLMILMWAGCRSYAEASCSPAFPYQISLQYGNGLLGFAHVCGGAILSSAWLLTAAHCLLEQPSLPFLRFRAVIIGNATVGQVVDVQTIITHPDYKGGVSPNDIALVRLKQALQLGKGARAVRLPLADVEPAGTALLAGRPVALLGYAECARLLVQLAGDAKPLAPSNLCSRERPGGEPACLGDSGGPLVTCDERGPTLVGIVSWGVVPCARGPAPSVYARVSAFLDFIHRNVY